ncbi:MAG: protein kinase [bacterium]|nr:protein kinase [bacterium]
MRNRLAFRRREVIVAIVVSLLLIPAFFAKLDLLQETAARQIGIHVDLEATDIRGLKVKDVIPGEPAEGAGIRAGDIIVEIDGMAIIDEASYDKAASAFARGRPVDFVVLRNNEKGTVVLAPGTHTYLSDVMLEQIVVVAHIVLGLVILLIGAGQLWARLVFWFSYLIAVEMTLPNSYDYWGEPLYFWGSLAFYAIAWLQMSVELHLAAELPERQPWLARNRWILVFFYGIPGLVAAFRSIGLWAVLRQGREERAFAWLELDGYVEGATFLVWGMMLIALLAYPSLRYPTKRGRRLARLILAGVLPWSLWAVAVGFAVLSGTDLSEGFLDAVVYLLLPYPVAILFAAVFETRTRESIFARLIHRLDDAHTLNEVSETLSRHLDEAFQPTYTSVFYRKEHSQDLTLGHSSGITSAPEYISSDSDLFRLAERHGATFRYPQDVGVALPGEDRKWLNDLGVRLIVPVRGGTGELLGLLLLGPRRSGAPYAGSDLRMLGSLSGHIGVVYENLRLRADRDQTRKVQAEVLAKLDQDSFNLVRECPSCGRCYDADEKRCEKDGAELRMSLPVERVVDGRYRIERLVGKGGMGAVYEASDLRLERTVALKIIHARLFGEGDALRRFEREARLSARLQHPNIVTVHDCGTTQTGGAFMVMELLEGFSLRTALDQSGRLQPPVAANWIDQAAAGVQYAHESAVVHRDLKPENIFLATLNSGEARIKLLDFGLAKLCADTMMGPSSLTRPGVIMGTIAYMAPEQLAGNEVDERSDIFSLGVVAVEAISGRPPFKGKTPTQLLLAISEGADPLPGEEKGVAILNAAIGKCLAGDPSERFSSVEELRAELVPAIESCSGLDLPDAEPKKKAFDGETQTI